MNAPDGRGTLLAVLDWFYGARFARRMRVFFVVCHMIF